MTRRQDASASVPQAECHIHHDQIVEKLEIARTIGLVTDYLVGPIDPPRQPTPRVTVGRNPQASDDGVKAYLTHLLNGVVPAGDIVVMHPFAASAPTSTQTSEPTLPRAMNDDEPQRSARFPWTAHLHKAAAAGAMLTCIAVVLNVGPFAKAPRVDSSVNVGSLAKAPKVDGPAINLAAAPAPAAAPVPVATEPAQDQSSVAQQDVVAVTPQSSPSADDARLPALARTMIEPPFSIRQAAASAAQAPEPQLVSARVEVPEVASSQPASDHATPERPTIVGVWAPDTGTCSARDFQQGMLPTVINAEGAWAGETFCIFTKRKETENGWTVVAKCSTPREHWTSNVRLTVTENRLTWTSRRGTQAYSRCSPDMLMAAR